MAAARRVESWALWAQLSMVARLLVAWRIAPPVATQVGGEDRCGPDGPADEVLAGRLRDEAMSAQACGRGWVPGHAHLLAEVFASTEIALACGLTNYAADRRVEVAEAVFVQDRLPRLRRLLRAGWVDWYKLDTFVRETGQLDPVVARAVERMILGDVPVDDVDVVDVLADPEQPGQDVPSFARMTVPQLRAAITAAVAAIDAEAAERRARAARTKRSVRCEAAADGTATLTADLAVEAAAAVWEALTAAARTAKAAGDPRSLDQLRADALLARTTGTPLPAPEQTSDGRQGDRADQPETPHSTGDTGDSPGDSPNEPPGDGGPASGGTTCGRCGQPQGDKAAPRRAGPGLAVSLTLPLSTYLGLTDDPGQLDGYGPVAAGLARQIIRDANLLQSGGTTSDDGHGRGRSPGLAGITWRCVITDDEHNTVLGVGAPLRVPRHDPPPRLADLVRTITPMCSFPGCRTRARECDLDHRIPYDPRDPNGGGPTCSCNLQALCRRHHRAKTAGLIHSRAVGASHHAEGSHTGTDQGTDQGADTATVLGTVDWTTPSGLRYRQPPPPAAPPPADLTDPEIARAVAHARQRALDADDADNTGSADAASRPPDDWADRRWRETLADYGRERARQAAARAAARAERERRELEALLPPPF